jgi:hypothetical protein
MYDITPLETEWKEYNKKRKRPFYMFSLIIILLSASIYFLDYKDLDIVKSYYVKVVNKLKSYGKNDNNCSVDSNKSIIKEPLTIKGSKKIKIDNKNAYPMDADDVYKEEKQSTKQIINFEIKNADDIEVLKEIEARFNAAPDSDDSIFLAQEYFKRKDYEKSAYWSLKTNKINGFIEESWIIFAQSKVKLGRKNEAINVLSEYIKKTGSNKAKKLLKKIK